MNKLVITRWNGRLLTALLSGREALEVGLEEPGSILGNIYIGRVKNIVKNLNSAFVDFGEGRTGYYSLTDNPVSLFADGGSPRPIKGGDLIVVQVAKDAVKTKDPVLTGNLNFTGKYAVLTAGKQVIGFSAKISDRSWKEALKPQLEALTQGEAGLIVRTNAYGMEEALLREVHMLLDQYRAVVKAAPYRTPCSLLYEAEPEYLKALRSCHEGTLEEIVTDDPDVFETVKRYLELYQPERTGMLRLYQDSMVDLASLYSLQSVMDQACQKRVWLKSGGYLIIEPTEAMVVIDVNTGKYSGRKNLADTIRMINLEAAREICRQLRLRNLSGIIMVDFIDMDSEEDKTLLLDTLRSLALADPVKVHVVDMTPLGLVEMTRKKGKKPLMEQLSRI
ncbi:MAG: ribonuclease E/G [Eubacteriales bacterium]|nr:ribonuclease E/G [Eubacteriales bacterium]